MQEALDIQPISILLVDERQIYRDALRRMLEQERGLAVVGDVSNPRQAVALAQALEPAVLLVSLARRPLMRFMRSLQAVTGGRGHGRVIVFGTTDNQLERIHESQLGEFGVLAKEASTQALIESVRSGGIVQPSTAGPRRAGGDITPDRDDPAESGTAASFGLTAREIAIVAAVGRGESTRTIARRLEISSETVKSQMRRIYAKAGVWTRSELAAFALRHQLTDP